MQDLHHVEAHVEPDKVGELERSHRMVQADPDATVDVLERAKSFLVGVHCFHEVRHQDAVHDEPRDGLC